MAGKSNLKHDRPVLAKSCTAPVRRSETLFYHDHSSASNVLAACTNALEPAGMFQICRYDQRPAASIYSASHDLVTSQSASKHNPGNYDE